MRADARNRRTDVADHETTGSLDIAMATRVTPRLLRALVVCVGLSFGAIARFTPTGPVSVAGIAFALPDEPPPTDTSPGADEEPSQVDLPAPSSATSPRPPAIDVRPEMMAAPPATMVAPELALIDETNRDRAAVGLRRLAPDPELIALARTRASAQVGRSTLSHLDDGGALAFLSLIQRAGLRHQVAGENLVRLPGPVGTAPPRAERALMSSPTHRANILDPRYGRLAIGMADDRDGRVIFAQLFRDGP